MIYKLVQTIGNKTYRLAGFEEEADAKLAMQDRQLTGMEGLKIIPTGVCTRTMFYKKGEYVPRCLAVAPPHDTGERAKFWEEQGKILGALMS